MTFEETGLKPEILRAISEMGFQKPTPIQEKTIPHLINNDNDLVALAQTGTGKTAAFGLPILNNIDLNSKKVQALILCPTRELCLQIARDLENFSKYLTGLNTIPVYGGAEIRNQIKALQSGGQIVVGTPGRTNDLIRRGKLDVSHIRYSILDEADEMLNMGFKEELDAILEDTPATKQTLLFSATMPSEIARMAKRYLNNPEELSVGSRNQGSDNVEHQYYVVQAKDKYATLKRVADNYPNCYAIVFCRTRMETRDVAAKFMADGYNADALHGDLSQAQRDNVMDRFRSKQLQMLIATDVAARGLDVNELTHVINYALPDDPEAYVHRSGRTGRAGNKGISVSILHSREVGKMRQIEKFSKKTFERKQVPGGDEICEVQLMHFINKVAATEVDHETIDPYLDSIKEHFKGMNADEILKHFVSVEFNRFIEYYRNAPDLNVKEKDMRDGGREGGRDGGKERKGKNANVSMSRMFINVGKKQNLSAGRLIGMINESLPVKNAEIGRIDIQRKFSFFEVDTQYSEALAKAMRKLRVEGVPVEVDRVQGEAPSGFQRSRGKKKFEGGGNSGQGNYRQTGGAGRRDRGSAQGRKTK
ncbi:MAG: DEAD/DEAH box helicase [Mangrovibacterium sp.]